MNKNIKIIGLILILFGLTGCTTVCMVENEYEYIDLFGNKGTASNCYMGYKAGGLYCELGENSMVLVSQYKSVESKEVCNR